jgi:hypothetical protein
MEGIVILGSLSSNRDPLRRIQVFEAVPYAYRSLEEAIQGAKSHYWTNFSQGKAPQFRVYQSTDPDGSTYALVEVSDGHGDMRFTALYKIIAGKYRWAVEQGAATASQTDVQTPVATPAEIPPAEPR